MARLAVEAGALVNSEYAPVALWIEVVWSYPGGVGQPVAVEAGREYPGGDGRFNVLLEAGCEEAWNDDEYAAAVEVGLEFPGGDWRPDPLLGTVCEEDSDDGGYDNPGAGLLATAV